MTPFIKLHRVDFKGTDGVWKGRPFYINPSVVLEMYVRTDREMADYTELQFSTGLSGCCYETPEEIIKLVRFG